MNKVDFQIKSTTRQLALRDGNILYNLSVENYNQLILQTTPRAIRQALACQPSKRGLLYVGFGEGSH